VSMQDSVADMLTRIRNAQRAKHVSVEMAASKFKEAIAKLLMEEGYIQDYRVTPLENNGAMLSLKLKYYQGEPVIERITRVSRPSCRVYKPAKQLAMVPGFGVAIVSTSMGLMTHKTAKARGIGGEVLCIVA